MINGFGFGFGQDYFKTLRTRQASSGQGAEIRQPSGSLMFGLQNGFYPQPVNPSPAAPSPSQPQGLPGLMQVMLQMMVMMLSLLVQTGNPGNSNPSS